MDKQCQGEGKLLSQYVITNREEGKWKPLKREISYMSPNQQSQSTTSGLASSFPHGRTKWYKS